MSQVIRSFFSLVVPILLIAIHFVVMLCFINRWDSVATVTLVPIWMWAAVGMLLAVLGWAFFKSRLSMLVFFIWLVTALICSDETPALLRSGKHWVIPPPGTPTATSDQTPNNGHVEAPRSLRIATLNCNMKDDANAAANELLDRFSGPDGAATSAIDVIFLQESPDEKMLAAITDQLFGPAGSWVRADDCAILARGRLEALKLGLDLDKQTPGTQVAATLELAPGDNVELINVHLKRSIVRYDVWRGEAWRAHTEVRIANRNRLRAIMKALPESVTTQPRIIGGDFGTPYNDDIYRVLKRHHRDAFRSVGAGWGNTFPAEMPLLRIDQIWTSDALTAVSADTFTIGHTDHRMVTAHFVITAQGGFLAMR